MVIKCATDVKELCGDGDVGIGGNDPVSIGGVGGIDVDGRRQRQEIPNYLRIPAAAAGLGYMDSLRNF